MASIVTVIIFFFVNSLCDGETPVIKTTTGLVRGKTLTTALGKEVDAYLGIPYGQPPLGTLRFKPSIEVSPWEGVFNATEEGFSCFQKVFQIAKRFEAFSIYETTTDLNEDCLNLNIWVPKIKSDRAPVMVYIYGGGNAKGGISTPILEPSILTTEEEVIIVMMNYRVASLGFLFLDHPDVPGNAGLYDQLLALKWIKANAEAFGGDPNSITLFGQSSGSSSVGQHILSPLSWGLFDRAIMESASPTSDVVVMEKKEAKEKSMTLVENLGCAGDRANLSSIIHCLQTADPLDIINSEIQRGYLFIFTHTPVVDGKFILEHPKKSLREGRFANVPVITGNVKDEGSIFYTLIDPLKFFPIKDDLLLTIDDFTEYATFYDFNKLTVAMIFYLYLGKMHHHIPVSLRYVDALVNLASDYGFHCPLTEFEIYYSKSGNSVFKYYMTHHTSTINIGKWMGTIHGEDLLYVFGDPFRGKSLYTKDEKILSRRIMRYWANFARTSDPNKSDRNSGEESIEWPRHTPEGREYLILAPNSTAVGKAFREIYCLFWRDFRKELRNILTEAKKLKDSRNA